MAIKRKGVPFSHKQGIIWHCFEFLWAVAMGAEQSSALNQYSGRKL
jgi:hypothetical protein